MAGMQHGIAGEAYETLQGLLGIEETSQALSELVGLVLAPGGEKAARELGLQAAKQFKGQLDELIAQDAFRFAYRLGKAVGPMIADVVLSIVAGGAGAAKRLADILKRIPGGKKFLERMEALGKAKRIPKGAKRGMGKEPGPAIQADEKGLQNANDAAKVAVRQSTSSGSSQSSATSTDKRTNPKNSEASGGGVDSARRQKPSQKTSQSDDTGTRTESEHLISGPKDAGSDSVTIQLPPEPVPAKKEVAKKRRKRGSNARLDREAKRRKKAEKEKRKKEEEKKFGSDHIGHSGSAGEHWEVEVEKKLGAKTIKNLKVIEGTYIGKGGEKVVYQLKTITSSDPVKAIRGYIGGWKKSLRNRPQWKKARRSANELHKGELHFELPESVHDPSITKELRFTILGKKPAGWAKTEAALRKFFDDQIPTDNKRIVFDFIETVSADEVLGR